MNIIFFNIHIFFLNEKYAFVHLHMCNRNCYPFRSVVGFVLLDFLFSV